MVQELRPLLVEMLEDFARSARSVEDPFGLLDADTPELPRYVMTLRAAVAQLASRRAGSPEPVVCDLGGYFGIVGAALSKLGYTAHVVDTFGDLATADEHADVRAWWQRHGIEPHDVDLQRADLRLPFEDESVDLVTLLAVIEHFPNTPRIVLEEAQRILRPDGLLIVDTPNAGAFGNRIGFLIHGEGFWAPIRDLYESGIPFLGHKRCYSRRELVATLGWAGFEPESVVVFDPAGRVKHNGSLGARLLYDVVYPPLGRFLPTLRDYLWVSARRAR